MVVNGALGAPKETALSYALVVHATLYFPITVWGAIEWWRQHLSLKQATEAEPEPGARKLAPATAGMERG
jgi:hypothetical protein